MYLYIPINSSVLITFSGGGSRVKNIFFSYFFIPMNFLEGDQNPNTYYSFRFRVKETIIDFKKGEIFLARGPFLEF